MAALRNFILLYPATNILILIQLWIWGLFKINETFGNYIFYVLSGVNYLIRKGELWRLLTPIFLHLHWNHLIYNLAILVLVGTFIENYFGSKFIFYQFIISGFLANLLTYFITPDLFVHFGSSSATLGVLGSIVFLVFSKQGEIPTFIYPFVFVALVMNVATSLSTTEVNIYGHLFGLFSGIIITWLYTSLLNGNSNRWD